MATHLAHEEQLLEHSRALWAPKVCTSLIRRRGARRARHCNPRSTAHDRTRALQLCVTADASTQTFEPSLGARAFTPQCLLVALAYACTAVGPAVGAASAAAGLSSIEWFSTLAGSAALAAVLSAVLTAALTACIAGTVDALMTSAARSMTERFGEGWQVQRDHPRTQPRPLHPRDPARP
jgi:hypothetical protein